MQALAASLLVSRCGDSVLKGLSTGQRPLTRCVTQAKKVLRSQPLWQTLSQLHWRSRWVPRANLGLARAGKPMGPVCAPSQGSPTYNCGTTSLSLCRKSEVCAYSLNNQRLNHGHCWGCRVGTDTERI